MPTFDPIETSSQFTSDRVFEVVQSKYAAAGNYAAWAQNLLETSLKDIKDKLDGNELLPAMQDLLALATGIQIYSPGTITGYNAPPAPIYETPPAFVPAVIGTIQDIPDYSAPDAVTFDAIPAYVKPVEPEYETIPDYVAPVIGALTAVPSYVAPTKPTYTPLPGYTAPQLAAMLDIPEMVPLSIPDAPSTAVTFTNAAFSDDLLTAMKSQVESDLGTGGEAAMFERHRQRVTDEQNDAQIEMTVQFSSRGFDMPTGAWQSQNNRAIKNKGKRLADVSADIMQARNQQAMTVGVQLLDMLGRLHDSKIMRDFEAAKTEVSLSLDGFKAIIEAEIAKGNLQKVFIDATVATNEGNVKVFMGKLEGQLEPIKAVVSVNQGLVQQYSSEITAAVAPIDAIVKNNDAIIRKYLGEIQAATDPIKALADVNKSYAQLYLADLEAALKPIQAAVERNSALAKTYQYEVEGELTPIKALVDINTNVVTQYATETTARVTPVKTVIDQNMQKAVAYQSAIQAAAETVKASAIDEDFKVKQNELELKGAQVRSSILSDTTKMAIEDAYRHTSMSVETLKAVSLQAAQMIASSWNTVGASVSMGYTGGASTRYDGNIDTHDATARAAIAAKIQPPAYN